ncbi:hypothetical protein TgHK011_008814 [Trichoderma gracile]|nr:hypothetical protein TgHK011_008814 [Trichoderma gracile]
MANLAICMEARTCSREDGIGLPYTAGFASSSSAQIGGKDYTSQLLRASAFSVESAEAAKQLSSSQHGPNLAIQALAWPLVVSLATPLVPGNASNATDYYRLPAYGLDRFHG